MKLSTKGRYGLRALVDLGIHGKGEYISLASISERENISEQYMEHVFSTMRKAGLVNSVKGPKGGYALASSPASIRISSVIMALEGDHSLAKESVSCESETCNHVEEGIRKILWEKIDEAVFRILDGTTLQDLIDEAKRHEAESSHMYYI